MGDLFDLSVTLSTPSTPLELNDHEAFEIVDWNPPIQQVIRNTLRGPYQSGDVLISAVRGSGVIGATVRVLGSTWAAQQANTESLFSALSQWSFTVTETINTVAKTYPAKPADIGFADGLDGFQVTRSRHEYVLSIPVNPPSVVEGS